MPGRSCGRWLAPLGRAAELSDDGNLYVRLGQVHIQREEWGDAAQMLRRALDKGDLRDQGNAVLLVGIALYNDSKSAEARRYFARARKYEDTRVEADRWITHIARENGSRAS